MKTMITKCDLCNKEIQPCSIKEYSLIRKGFFLIHTEEILDICDECIEKFKHIHMKKNKKTRRRR
jgi:hypothetical protein